MERTSYLTEQEVFAIQHLHKNAPYALCNVSQGFFSISRHYGACMFGDCRFIYIEGHDECVIEDVLRFVRKLRKLKAKVKASEEVAPVQYQMYLE